MTSQNAFLVPLRKDAHGNTVLSDGSPLPDGWSEVQRTRFGFIKKQAQNEKWLPGQTTVYTTPEETHREKSFGVMIKDSDNNGVFVVGAGREYTERLKEVGARILEKRNRNIGTEADRKAADEAWRNEVSDYVAERMEMHKRNHRTDPAPNYTQTRKNLF